MRWQRDFAGKKSEFDLGSVSVKAEGDSLSGGVTVSAGSPVKLRPTEDKPLLLSRRGVFKEPLLVEAEQSSGGFKLEILIVFEDAKGRIRLRRQLPLMNGVNEVADLVEDGDNGSSPAGGPAEVYLFAVRGEECVSNLVKLDGRIEQATLQGETAAGPGRPARFPDVPGRFEAVTPLLPRRRIG